MWQAFSLPLLLLLLVQGELCGQSFFQNRGGAAEKYDVSKLDVRKTTDRKKMLEMEERSDRNNGVKFYAVGSSGKPLFLSEQYFFRVRYPNSSTIYTIDNIQYNGRRLLSLDSAENKTGCMCTRTVEWKAGDTITFFRSLQWISGEAILQNPDKKFVWKDMAHKYQAYHDLAWSLELVSYHTGKRLLLVDSLCIVDSPTLGVPQIISNKPPFSSIVFVLPATFSPEKAYLNIQPYAFNRTKKVLPEFKTSQGKDISSDIEQELYNNTEGLQQFAGLVNEQWAINHNNLMKTQDSYNNNFFVGKLVVVPNPTSKDIQLHYYSLDAKVLYSVAIYNTLGQLLSTWSKLHTPLSLQYSFEQSGIYHVIVQNQSGTLLASQKVVVR